MVVVNGIGSDLVLAGTPPPPRVKYVVSKPWPPWNTALEVGLFSVEIFKKVVTSI